MEGNDAGYVGVRGQREVYNAEKVKLMKMSITPPLGIDESKSELRIFPNPTSSLVYLSEKIDYKLYNVVGTLVKQGVGNSIDLSTLSNGVYILESEYKKIKIIKK